LIETCWRARTATNSRLLLLLVLRGPGRGRCGVNSRRCPVCKSRATSGCIFDLLFSTDRAEGKGGDEHAMSSCSVTDVWPALGERSTNDGDDDGAWVAVAGAERPAKMKDKKGTLVASRRSPTVPQIRGCRSLWQRDRETATRKAMKNVHQSTPTVTPSMATLYAPTTHTNGSVIRPFCAALIIKVST
jgi:hypothetical protein